MESFAGAVATAWTVVSLGSAFVAGSEHVLGSLWELTTQSPREPQESTPSSASCMAFQLRFPLKGTLKDLPA